MGWARQSKNPKRFVEMLGTLNKYDLNVLLIDYDKRFGFGNKKQIDIWWRGDQDNGNLSLTMAKLLTSSEDWYQANIRLLAVNMINEENVRIFKSAEEAAANRRLKIEIKIINNEIEQKPFYDIIHSESINTDLILLEIPSKIEAGKEKEFVEKTSDLMHKIGTVVLINASSQFKKLNFGTSFKTLKTEPGKIGLVIKEGIKLPEISFPENNILANEIDFLINKATKINERFYFDYFTKVNSPHIHLTSFLVELINKSLANIESKLTTGDNVTGHILLEKARNIILIKSKKEIVLMQKEAIETQKNILTEGLNKFVADYNTLTNNLSNKIFINYNLNDLTPDSSDNLLLKWFKFRSGIAIKFTGQPILYSIKYKKLSNKYLPVELYPVLREIFEKWGVISLQFIVEMQRIIKSTDNILFLLENRAKNKLLTRETFLQEKQKIEQMLAKIVQLNEDSQQSVFSFLMFKTFNVVQQFSNDLKQTNVNSKLLAKTILLKKHREWTDAIVELPVLWHRNLTLLYNAAIIEQLLLSFGNKLRKIFHDTSYEIKQIFSKTVFYKFTSLNNYLDTFVKELENEPTTQFDIEKAGTQSDEDNYYLILKEMIEHTFRNLKIVINKFPETIDIMNNESFNSYVETQFENMEVIQIYAARLLDYIVQDELIEPLQKIIDNLSNDLHKSNIVCQDIVRLISFSIHKPNDNLLSNADEINANIKTFIREQQGKITTELNNVKKLENEINTQVDELLTSTINKLSLYSFTKIAENFKQYTREQETKKKFLRIRKKTDKIKQFVNHQLDQMLYRQSEAVILAKNIDKADADKNARVDELLNLLEEVSVSEETLNKLPFYYRQLFLQKHDYNREFWYGREKELANAKKTFRRYGSGFLGGILITGEQNSGKTSFSQYISKKYYEDSTVFQLNPPQEGSVDPQIFKRSLQKCLEIKGSYKVMFDKIPLNSIVIIDDLELWWEKSKDGLLVIDIIIDIIEKYSNHCLFIVNANNHSFENINRLKKIDTAFLNIIELKPFNAESLKNIIMFRHQSSGLKFTLKNKQQENFRSIDYANLFTKYFNYSQGNIGVALQSWASNITGVEDNRLIIKAPKTPELSVLDKLETDIFVLLVQFVLHRHLTIKRLERITLLKKEALLHQINFLLRSGIITCDIHKVYRINKFIDIHLKTKLIEMEML
jgi:hypothetical protein